MIYSSHARFVAPGKPTQRSDLADTNICCQIIPAHTTQDHEEHVLCATMHYNCPATCAVCHKFCILSFPDFLTKLSCFHTKLLLKA